MLFMHNKMTNEQKHAIILSVIGTFYYFIVYYRKSYTNKNLEMSFYAGYNCKVDSKRRQICVCYC